MDVEDVRMEGSKSEESFETLPETYPGGMSAAEIISDLRHSLNPDKFNIRGSELQQLLVSYAEQHIEPAGWQALFRRDPKIPSTLSMSNNLSSPAVVEVYSLIQCLVYLRYLSLCFSFIDCKCGL